MPNGFGVYGSVWRSSTWRLVEKDTQLHPVLDFIGVMGGVALFGIRSLLFGSLAMSVAVTLISIPKCIFREECRGI